jgi:hypothetical protein
MTAVGSEDCPHCDGRVAAINLPFGSSICKSCGQPLWFLTIDGAISFFRHSDAAFVWKLFNAIPEHQRLPAKLAFDNVDALDLVLHFKAALESAAR